MKRQEKLVRDERLDDGLDDERLDWELGTNIPSQLQGRTSKGVTRSESTCVADVTVQDFDNDTLAMTEVALSQGRQEALAKIKERLTNNPKLVGAVVISIDESSAYKGPKRKGVRADALVMPSWKSAIKGAPMLGPIEYRGFRWAGSITCSLDVCLRGKAPHNQQIVSLLPYPYPLY
jgi:hypothetical protein